MPIQLKRDCDVVKRRHNTDTRWQGNAERLKAASGHRFWVSTHMLIEDWSGELLEAEAGIPDIHRWGVHQRYMCVGIVAVLSLMEFMVLILALGSL